MPALVRVTLLPASSMTPLIIAVFPATVLPTALVIIALPPESVTGPPKVKLFSVAAVKKVMPPFRVRLLLMTMSWFTDARICAVATAVMLPVPKGPEVTLPAEPVELTCGMVLVFALRVVPPL